MSVENFLNTLVVRGWTNLPDDTRLIIGISDTSDAEHVPLV